MKKLAPKFVGPLEALQEHVAESGFSGFWESMPAGYWRYVCQTGAILNWWPSTKTINFQGRAEAAGELRMALQPHIGPQPAENSPLPHDTEGR